MNIYISIGSQCTTPTLFDNLQVKKETLPFDWMFSTPQFVYAILNFLLVEQKEISDIVDNHFFACNRRVTSSDDNPAHFVDAPNGFALINSKYNVVFPHDTILNREKYIRRLERLKRLILDENIFIYFVYVSLPNHSFFTVNEMEPIQELYEYIEKINETIGKIRTNYQIIIFDVNKPSGIVPSDKLHIAYYELEMKNAWIELMPELIDKCNNIIHKNT